MRAAIRAHLRDFVAILALVVLAAGVSLVILQEQRLRIPILEERPFELKAEVEDAGAVVAGQGQTLRVAGVRVGDVQDVELSDGVAMVTFDVDREFLPIYRDATLLLRPQTGLEDMFFQMDPGSRAAGVLEEGETIPLANTAPDVELSEILAQLDADTQAYLRTLLVGGGRGLDRRGEDLGELLGTLGPINAQLRRLNTEVAKRKRNLATLIHNFNRLAAAVGRANRDLTELVQASNSAVGAIAERDPDVRRAIRLLPGTLRETTETLNDVVDFTAVAGPTFDGLRPFARKLDGLNDSLRSLANETTPVIEDEIRPFVRTATPEVPELARAARRFSSAAPDLTAVGNKLNRLTNMAAFNPNGAEPPGTPDRDEGYLYWLAWLSHNGNNVFSAQDANGLIRRIYLTVGCEEALTILGDTPLSPAITGLGALFAPGAPFEGVCN